MKILIVEDEPSLREIMAQTLRREQYVVEEATDYASGLDKIAAYDYDCILLDIMLPDGSGLKLLEELKRRGLRAGVIIISARDSLDDKIGGLELGADDYLPKPFHTAELLARIRGQQPGWLLLSRNGAFPKLAPTPEAEAFSLPLPLGERAYIFGGGHIALALTPLLASIGFRVTVMDNRPEYADPQRFPQAEAVVCGDYTRLRQYFTLTPEDYAIVMTNGHSFDYEAEKQILLGDFAYLGVIGSRKKTAAVNAKLLADGLSQSLLDQVHTPIGLPILAVTPEEIAVSIAAEMILVRARRRGQAGSAPSHACPMH